MPRFLFVARLVLTTVIQAFRKQDRPAELDPNGVNSGGDQAFTADETTKAPLREWALEPWAITHGVISTTRYRKGSSNRRVNMISRRSSHRTGPHASRHLSRPAIGQHYISANRMTRSGSGMGSQPGLWGGLQHSRFDPHHQYLSQNIQQYAGNLGSNSQDHFQSLYSQPRQQQPLANMDLDYSSGLYGPAPSSQHFKRDESIDEPACPATPDTTGDQHNFFLAQAQPIESAQIPDAGVVYDHMSPYSASGYSGALQQDVTAQTPTFEGESPPPGPTCEGAIFANSASDIVRLIEEDGSTCTQFSGGFLCKCEGPQGE